VCGGQSAKFILEENFVKIFIRRLLMTKQNVFPTKANLCSLCAQFFQQKILKQKKKKEIFAQILSDEI
jgi:hypothetical protein